MIKRENHFDLISRGLTICKKVKAVDIKVETYPLMCLDDNQLIFQLSNTMLK